MVALTEIKTLSHSPSRRFSSDVQVQKDLESMFSSSVLQPFKDFFFVSSCFHCGSRLHHSEQRICSACWNSITPVRSGDHTVTVLQQRFEEGGVVDGLAALCYFEKGKLLQSLAHSLKYEEVTSFGFELGVRLVEKVKTFPFDLIIPVPLNRRKERERGYNQSDWIAKGISSVIRIPFRTDVISRTKYTVTQTHLNAEQRKENIAEAFVVVDEAAVKGKSILIVDDIITTGSTIQEVARGLKQAGVLTVYVGAAGLAKLGEDR